MMISSTTKMSEKKTAFQQKQENKHNSTWSTLKVQELMVQMDEGYQPQITPFWEGAMEWRAPNIVFEHTAEEFAELKRCADDVVYFSNRYAFAMTDFGIEQITLRPYQEDVMRDFADTRWRHNVFLSPRQSGKCVEYGTIITIKNADTGEIFDLPIGRFYFNLTRNKTTFDYILYGLNELKIMLQKFKKVDLAASFISIFA